MTYASLVVKLPLVTTMKRSSFVRYTPARKSTSGSSNTCTSADGAVPRAWRKMRLGRCAASVRV
jgi:hypothetical protein